MGNCFDCDAQKINLSKEEKLRTETGSQFQKFRSECEMTIHGSLQKLQQYEQKKVALARMVKQSGRPPTVSQKEEMTACVTQIRAHRARVESARNRFFTLHQAEHRIGRLIDAKRDAQFHTDIAKEMKRMGFNTDAAERDIRNMEDIFDSAQEFTDEVESSLGRDNTDQVDVEEEAEAAWQMDLDDAPKVPPNSGQEFEGYRRDRRRGWPHHDKQGQLLEDDTQAIELHNAGKSEVMYDFNRGGTDEALVAEFGA